MKEDFLLALRGVLIATNIAALVLAAFFAYLVFLKNYSGTGFLSWNPIRRIGFVVSLPRWLALPAPRSLRDSLAGTDCVSRGAHDASPVPYAHRTRRNESCGERNPTKCWCASA